MAADAYQARYIQPADGEGLTPAIKPIVTPADAEPQLAIVRGLAKILDEAITLPVINRKVGLDAILGLIPGVGDLGSAAIGGYILLVASKLGVPAVVLWRMFLNLAVDTALGAIPFAGDIFDAAYRANSKNAALLLGAIEDPARTRRASRWVVMGLGLAFVGIVAAGIVASYLLIRWLLGGA